MKTNKLIDKKILQSLTPINQLDPDIISELSETTYFETLSKGDCIFTAGVNDSWVYYLLSGNVVIITPGTSGGTQLEGGSEGSRQPLIHTKPREATVVANGDVIFIRILDRYVKDFLDKSAAIKSSPTQGGKDTNQSIMNDNDAATQILNEIKRDIAADKLIVPSLPDVAIKVREAVQQADADVESVAKLVQTDPPLAARLIQVANSPMYRGQKPINICHAAVSRLGLKVTRDLVIGCSLQQLFESDSAELQKLMAATWEQSTFVGAISAVIARFVPHLDNDRALLLGLLHNIGVLPILAYGKKFPSLVSEVDLLQTLIKKMSVRVGALVLRRWQFDPEMVAAMQSSQDWFRDSGKNADYCDVVLLAQLYSNIDADKKEDFPAIDETPAFKKMPLGRMGEKMTVRLLDTARSEIEEIQRLLQG